MRIVALSDTHSLHRSIVVPEGDVLIHAGDLTWRGEEHEYRSVAGWFNGLPHKSKIVIAGNHDWNCDKYAHYFNDAGCVYLHDSGVEVDGVKIYGSPWQPEFCNWAWNLPRGAALREKWSLIPYDTQVLVTHGPPMGILDKVTRGTMEGCADLMSRISNLDRLKLSIFGHIHEQAGTVVSRGITFVNASICTLQYKPTNPPIVVDL